MCKWASKRKQRERKNACVFQGITAELNWVCPGRHHCIHSSTSVHKCSDLSKLKTEDFVRERLKENKFCFGKVLIPLHSPSMLSHFNVSIFLVSLILSWEALGWQIMNFPSARMIRNFSKFTQGYTARFKISHVSGVSGYILGRLQHCRDWKTTLEMDWIQLNT